MNSSLALLRVGGRLRSLREECGFTLAEVNHLTGVTVSQLSLIENGRVDPRLSTIQRVLAAYGADLSALALDEPVTLSLHDVLAWRAQGRANVESRGLSPSDPERRLDRRQRLGDDTTSERAAVAEA